MTPVAENASLIAAAQAGDERAFVELTSPHRRPLHVHCYRLLGSVHDADDALQEVLLRAWRGIGGYEPRAPIGAWLYRIATNVCLRMLEERNRHRGIAVDAHLEPYPEPAAPAALEPPTSVESDEAVGLAFIAAMQLLAPRQRVVLVLRDVLDWSAREVAALLDSTEGAVNSALQRARERIRQEQQEGSLARAHRPASGDAEARVMQLFQDAWKAVDINGILKLLAHDALLTMPPEGMRFQGDRAVAQFFATVPLDGRLDRIRLIALRANGQPTLAAYAENEDGDGYDAYGVMVFAIEDERIASITGFPRDVGLFLRLGLAASITRSV